MMGKINISAFGLWVGALGQFLLLGNLFDRVPHLLVFAPLLGPWLLLYVISFCRVAPCGPSRFAQLVIIGVAWYSFDTVMCELVRLLVPTSRSRVYSDDPSSCALLWRCTRVHSAGSRHSMGAQLPIE